MSFTAKNEIDEDSRLGTYFSINPDLQSYVPKPQTIMEKERKITTIFRAGSHSLNIEAGRYTNTPRENRLCSCGLQVQTMLHIFKTCPITTLPIESNYQNLREIFEDDKIPASSHCNETVQNSITTHIENLVNISVILRIRTWTTLLILLFVKIFYFWDLSSSDHFQPVNCHNVSC